MKTCLIRLLAVVNSKNQFLGKKLEDRAVCSVRTSSFLLINACLRTDKQGLLLIHNCLLIADRFLLLNNTHLRINNKPLLSDKSLCLIIQISWLTVNNLPLFNNTSLLTINNFSLPIRNLFLMNLKGCLSIMQLRAAHCDRPAFPVILTYCADRHTSAGRHTGTLRQAAFGWN